MTHTAVVLFTRDLRVHDHPALAGQRLELGYVDPIDVEVPAR